MRLLVIEDDAATAAALIDGLRARGHSVDLATDGRAGLLRFADEIFDVAIVDRMLPEFDGLSIVRAVRAGGVATPVILLTALGGVSDRIQGLSAGSDDYLVKPFDLDELDARVHALGRRPPIAPALELRRRGVVLDRLARLVVYDGRPLSLTASEYAILELLMLSAGQTVTKSMILEQVFGLDRQSPGMVVEPHVSRLRAKLTDVGAGDPILTVRRRGYAFAED